MNIELSGKNKTVADGITVAELIAQEQLETPEHVKVAVNDDFVEREQFADTRLHDGDVVEFLTFMGGGHKRGNSFDSKRVTWILARRIRTCTIFHQKN